MATENYHRVNSCGYCANLNCKDRKEDMTCNDFKDAGFIKVIPNFPAMSQRDWEILSS